MSRRKQPKPRSLKFEEDENEISSSPESSASSVTGSEEGETSTTETGADSDFGSSSGITEANPYACQFCASAFPRLASLKKHEQSHRQHMPFRCEFCRRLFKHKRSRDRHVKLHTGDKKYRCSQCAAAFSRSDHLKIHMKTHDNQKPYQCKFCSRGYTTMSALTSHLRDHKRQRTLHSAQISNQEETPVQMPVGENQESSPKEKSGQILSCKHCHTSCFISQEELQKHIKSCQGSFKIKCENAKRDVSPGSTPLIEDTCPICSIPFSSGRALRAHLTASHTPDQIYMESDLSCIKCFLPFPNSRSLIEHWLYCHRLDKSLGSLPPDEMKPTDLSIVRKEDLPNKKKTQANPSEFSLSQEEVKYEPGTLLCNQCNAALPDFESFRTHLKSHLEVSSNNLGGSVLFGLCSYCRIPMSSLQEMVKHISTHILTTITEYSCNICLKIFSGVPELEQHLMEVHSQQLFLCYACKEVFETRFSLQRHFASKHLKERRKYACRLCQTSPPFPSESEFEQHIRNFHSGIDQVLTIQDVSLHCAYCNEVHKSRKDLETHMRHHCQAFISFGKHKCNICDEICNTPASLAEHKLTHCKVIYGSSCSHCKESLRNEDSFLSHLISHNNGLVTKGFQLSLPVSCVICRQTLVSESETKLHAKFHLRIEGGQCSVCHQLFNTCDLKENVCLKCLESTKKWTQCDRTVLSITEMENNISKDRRMLECYSCKSFFLDKDKYDSHLEVSCSPDSHHGGKCNICLMVLSSETKLQVHLIEHTFIGCPNFTCYICGAVFTIAHGLQRHISEHGIALKPYTCTKCSKKFFFRAELDNHLFYHQMNIPIPSIIKNGESLEEPRAGTLKEVGIEDNNNNKETDFKEENAEKIQLV